MTAELGPLGVDASDLREATLKALVYAVGKDPEHAVARDWCVALTRAVRDRVVDRWMPTTRRIYGSRRKRVYYLSMEFLIGRLLNDTIINLGIADAVRAALRELRLEPEAILAAEPDAALGNGGLGRLAACFLDSMATLGIAGYGYGIRYQHGLFKQRIGQGWQLEQAEDWLQLGDPWAFERPEVTYRIGFGGSVDGQGAWQPAEQVLATASDTPIVGFGGRHVNTLRLWAACPAQMFDLEYFNRGDFIGAAAGEILAETISRVLYPDDSTPAGRELRLRQEYFFTAASLQDLLRRAVQEDPDLSSLPQRVAIQLNDTHPAIAVPELLRLLIDEHGLAFEPALAITRGCIAYTNHTLMPEALERWPVAMMSGILPRHMQLIDQLDRRFVAEIRASGQEIAADRAAIVERGGGGDRGAVRMGHLAFYGSHKVNGVSALHTELMARTVFRDLHLLFPERIVNQTNGITPRRWLLNCNPELARLITDAIGERWVVELERLQALEGQAEDAGFRDAFAAIKQANKRRLAAEIERQLGFAVDPAALFDVQIKRIHEYKRQLLNALEALARYLAIRRAPDADWQPRVKIFAGKAAPSYVRAKLIIKLINDIAALVNNDPIVGDRLKVAFLPNYNVSLAEIIIPGADLSEQISTAGMEASGTGNMKLALNGALTIGTLDGANIEIRDRVGADNIFIFGLTAEEVVAQRAAGRQPHANIAACPALAEVVEAIDSGRLSPDQPDRFRPIVDDLRHGDYFMITADFAAYLACQELIDRAYRDQADWQRRAVRNTAGVGWFSSDRTIRGYARDIWQVEPV
jgi:starch phosphorylase